MSKLYSALTGGFYDPTIHGNSIPADAKPITLERHAELLEAQARGKDITSDANGLPIAADPPSPSLDDLRAIAADAIRIGLNASIKKPVPASGSTWNGGMDSALAIDGAVRLAEQIGQTSIALFDSNNAEHIVSIETGKQIAAAVGTDYQTKLARKQQLLRDIAGADEDQLKSISWQ